MTRLPIISGKDAIKKFEKLGYVVTRQKGSHVRMTSTNPSHLAFTIPLSKTLKKGLLTQLIKSAGITVEEFRKLYFFTRHCYAQALAGGPARLLRENIRIANWAKLL